MTYKELQQKTQEELHGLLAQKRDELRALRFKVSNGQLKQIHLVSKNKKEIARILMALNNKQSQTTA